MNPFDFKENGLTFVRGLEYIGISALVVTGLGSIGELATKGKVGCRPVFELDPKPVPAILHLGTRCGFRDQNIIGLTFTTKAGLDEKGTLVFGVPGLDLELFGRR